MNEIDERIVEMQFNNKDFEKNIQTSIKSLNNLDKTLEMKDSGKGLSNLQKIANSMTFEVINRGIETVQYKFNALQIAGITAIQNITNSAMAMGKNLVQAFTIDPVKTGLQEYETQIGAVQTILANTESKGSTLQDVNRALDELNTYADQTIYNFTEMTRNIGTFTAAGVELDKAVTSIKGIANLAAVSGSTSQQASTAMYQLSQALAAGKIQLMDWNSVVNAGMGGEVFQTALKRTAANFGYNVDEMIKKYGSFRESLTEGGWLTAEVLTETLTQLSGAYTEADLIAQGYTEEQAKQIVQLAETAVNAATKVKTFTQLIDTTKEAVQSGWTQTWEIIIGDFEEAKELWTGISNVLGDIINSSSEARNKLLSGGLSSGWKQFLNSGISDEQAIKDTISTVANEYGISVDEMIEKNGSFEKSLKEGWLTSDIMAESVKRLTEHVNGLSAEERKNAGYTAANVEELNKLNEEIQNGTVNLESFTELMVKGSGRENVISGLANIFKALSELIKPVQEGFREIFPPMTGEQLYKMTESFKTLTERIKFSQETINNIKSTFKGFFAILSIGKQVIEGLFTLFSGVAQRLFPMSNGLLSVTSRIGEFFVSIDEAAKELGIFKSIANGILSILDKIAESVQPVIQLFKDLAFTLSNQLSLAFRNVGNRVSEVAKPFSLMGNIVEPIFSGMVKTFEKLEPVLLGLGAIFASVFKYISDSVSNMLTNFDVNKVFDLINGGLFAGILLGVKNFISSLTDITDNAGGFLDNINGILEGVKDTLTSYQEQIKAKTLMQIAGAVGILAASLFVIASIDSKKLTDSLIAISVLFGNLMTAMKLTEKISVGGIKSAASFVTIMMGFSTSLLILAAALKTVSSIPWDNLVSGLVGLVGLSAIVVISAKALSKAQQPLIKGSIGLIGFAAAILLLSKAVEPLSRLDLESLGRGLLGVGVLCAEVAAFVRLTDFGKIKASSAVGLIALSVALNILSKAVESLSKLDLTSLGKGVGAVGVLLTEITLFNRLNGKSANVISTSTGLVILGGALAILAEAVKRFGSLDMATIGKGWLALSGALASITLALRFIPKNIVGSSLGLVGVATALVILGEALKTMGSMSWEQIGASLTVLSVALAELVIAMHFMSTALPAAGALLVISAALNLLALALKALGSMSLEAVIISLVTLAGTLAIIGGAAVLLTPVIPVILSLAGSIALFGAACLAVGAGVLAFSAGLSALAVSGTAGAAALVAILTSIIGLIPMIIKQIGIGIVELANVFIQGAPSIGMAFMALISTLLAVLVTVTPKIVTAMMNMMSSMLQGIASYVPQIVQSGIDIFVAFVSGLTSRINEIVNVVINFINTFLYSLASNSPRLATGAFNAMTIFINSLADTIREKTPELLSAVGNLAGSIIEGLVNGLLGGLGEVAGSVIDLGAEALNSIKDFLGIHSPSTEFQSIGQYITQGLVNGINTNPEAIQIAMQTLANNLLMAIQLEYPRFIECGAMIPRYIQSGLLQGIPVVETAVVIMLTRMINIIMMNRNGFYMSGQYLVQGFISGIQSKIAEAAAMAAQMAQEALDAANTVLGVASPSKKFIEVGKFVAMGLANGISSYAHLAKKSSENMGTQVINSAKTIAKNISDAINNDIDDNDLVIRPVVDMSDVEEKSRLISSTLSQNAAIDVSTSNYRAQKAVVKTDDSNKNQNELQNTNKGTVVNYTQINNSPKALDRTTIYRQTKNQLSTLKGALSKS